MSFHLAMKAALALLLLVLGLISLTRADMTTVIVPTVATTITTLTPSFETPMAPTVTVTQTTTQYNATATYLQFQPSPPTQLSTTTIAANTVIRTQGLMYLPFAVTTTVKQGKIDVDYFYTTTETQWGQGITTLTKEIANYGNTIVSTTTFSNWDISYLTRTWWRTLIPETQTVTETERYTYTKTVVESAKTVTERIPLVGFKHTTKTQTADHTATEYLTRAVPRIDCPKAECVRVRTKIVTHRPIITTVQTIITNVLTKTLIGFPDDWEEQGTIVETTGDSKWKTGFFEVATKKPATVYTTATSTDWMTTETVLITADEPTPTEEALKKRDWTIKTVPWATEYALPDKVVTVTMTRGAHRQNTTTPPFRNSTALPTVTVTRHYPGAKHYPGERQFPSYDGVNYLSGAIRIGENKHFDGQMKFYDRDDGTCANMTHRSDHGAMFILEDGAALSNVLLGPTNLGIQCRGSCNLTNVWWRENCGRHNAVFFGQGIQRIKGGAILNPYTPTPLSSPAFLSWQDGTVEIEDFYARNVGILWQGVRWNLALMERQLEMRSVRVDRVDVVADYIWNSHGKVDIQDSCFTDVRTNYCVGYHGFANNYPDYIDFELARGANGTKCATARVALQTC